MGYVFAQEWSRNSYLLIALHEFLGADLILISNQIVIAKTCLVTICGAITAPVSNFQHEYAIFNNMKIRGRSCSFSERWEKYTSKS
jgi:uncharacterized membrane protein YecN with MAPEG domain